MIVTGRAIKLGDDVDTDAMLPGKYLTLTDPLELAKHAMEGLDPDFPKKAKEGAVLVGGRNLGHGSSREQAPVALKYAGVRCVLAESFARIFFRNSINIGLPALECRGISELVDEGDELVVDVGRGEVVNRAKGTVAKATALPPFLIDVLEDGGLVEHLRKRAASGGLGR